MKSTLGMLPIIALAGIVTVQTPAFADALVTHRIPSALAVEAATEAVRFCAEDGHEETAVVVDANGSQQAMVRGDGAATYTLDSAYDKAYTAASFKRDTSVMFELARNNQGPSPLQKLPHVFFFSGGVVIKIGNEVIGAIGASGAIGSVFDEACAKAGAAKIQIASNR